MSAAPQDAPVSRRSFGASLLAWIDARFPLTSTFKKHASEYYAPKNFNVWYYFGAMALVALILQLVTGLFLAMHYKPSAAEAFASVEYIMRDVEWGWLIRYLHSTGASAFFVVVYLHMFRSLLYGSYRNPRELVWILGMLICLCLMAEAFFGYLLPWGNMSYWGAQVIVSLFGAIPGIGESLVEWIRGDYYISDSTLNRFFALHVVALPLALVFLVIVHILALHEVGSNNPDGIEIDDVKDTAGHPADGIPFHPYYTVKDLVSVIAFIAVLAAVVFFAPGMGGYFLESANFEPADPLRTPEHIAPVWYFTPFYAILRAVPDKLLGVLLMGAAVVAFLFLPWLDRSKVKSIRYRGWLYRGFLIAFATSFLALGYLGLQPATPAATNAARVFAVVYFSFFVLMPWYSRVDRTSAIPTRTTSAL
ncbi:ubiquinol-cytochrome c reductase cytochrome b subunit [Povalibacter uvarum]|uniref:Cytochrome b n=1 Tax=Povalibacter uvarum TaxID=732238 RepID=A0A841HMW1_9GAMM|nr:cytochrome bc complex cytochrome b subunit [Povalibacter uvarum]MBB6093944.1 ubiquinol-cytochrome c reductase cytochrome b subunit [Povalibacter uvarum]